MTSQSITTAEEAKPDAARSTPGVVPLPRGSFLMGSDAGDKFATDTERPRHRVTFEYCVGIGRHPVTAGEFRTFDPDHRPMSPGEWPAVNVNWIEATQYCAWLGDITGKPFRLPTEAEWEYACRAGTTTPFAHGSELRPSDANFLYSESGERIGPGSLRPVGSYPANPYGIHDLHGNVCEWVADAWHSDYDAAPNDGRAWLESTSRADARHVIRGGAWDYLPRLLRSAWRDALPAYTRRDNVGFRVALTLES